MNAWLNEHYMYLIAIAAGFALRWGAMQFLANATGGGNNGGGRGGHPGGPGGPQGGGGGGRAGKWSKGRIIKFLTLAFVFAAGLLLAYGVYPLARWIVGWGEGFGGWVSVAASVALLAAGWHALHGLVGLVHDMVDGTPDKEAFTAAFLVPTTLPLGWVALVGLFTNPRGLATGVATVAVSAVTAIYAHKILKKAHAAQGHYRAWMYLAMVVSIFVGIAHIAAVAYLNQLAGDFLPEWLAWILRAALATAAIVFFVVGLGDWVRDFTPEKWSQWAAMYSIPVYTVLIVSLVTLQSNATTSLERIFGAMQ